MAFRKPKVLVAMSGGVDSSVAAALLVREGYEVVGCFMRLGSPGEELDSLVEFDDRALACNPARIKIGHQGCCSINDAADARLVAAELGVPFYVCNFKKDFGRIIDHFVDEYAAGRTPNPCVRCNDWLKFGKLHEYARAIGAEFVASGHYARVVSTGGGGGVGGGMSGVKAAGAGHPPSDIRAATFALLRGLDHGKDQSYVLFGVPRSQLSHMLLPIGGFEKSRVREMALEFGLPTFDKPDSQEICFVPDNDYAGLVERRRPELAGSARGGSGTIVDSEGRVLGRHGGQHRFTIGQRKGLGIGGVTADGRGVPLFVLSKDAATNTVMVGPREKLMARSCVAGEANWLVAPPEPAPGAWRACWAKYRYNTAAVRARVRVVGAEEGASARGGDTPGVTPSGRTGRFEVVFDEPQQAVAPGQAVALYDDADPEVVMGGGWISAVQM
ncbi:MAG: tRNA 2-thiouridine(34) synthase MnmA [Phycisphaerales bacterium]|nr:tRNA 2-thiouridine(34) synthase MnmA [Phycisphaerales bacterium]